MSDADEHWRPAHTMQPRATFRHKVRAEQLTDAVTATDDIFVLAHFGIPRIALSDWALHIGGQVKNPLTLTLDDLKAFPKVEIESFIKCAGFPHDPTIATRSVSNAMWGGADLLSVLEAVGVDPAARYLWASGPDHGTYARWSADRYTKDLPFERVRAARHSHGRVLLAYEVNGEPLPVTHGFPLRLLVPGFYGTNSVKWLCRLEASDVRAPGTFTNELYNDPAPTGRLPVWRAAPEALIVAPADHGKVAAGPLDVWGWCWGDDEIAHVDVSFDDGQSWQRAQTASRRHYAWQKFALRQQCQPGLLSIMARATSMIGETQPERDARNSIHRIKITVA
jgi:DMSO/TMAO reductase YedYZ molybdopterin-dependent catalytic subunit